MKKEFNNILELQKTDIRIDKLNNQLANLPEKSRIDELEREKESWHVKQQALAEEKKGFELAFNKLNGELDLLSQKITKEEAKLYGGKISNPKELSSLQQELKVLNNNKDNLETQVLEQMDKDNAYVAATNKVNAKLNSIEEELKTSKESLATKEAEANKQVEDLKSDREAIAKEIDKDWLADYEDIRERKGGIAAAALIAGVCQVCHVQVPATELEDILKKDEPDLCPSCGRILIVK